VNSETPEAFSIDDLRARARSQLSLSLPEHAMDPVAQRASSDYALNPPGPGRDFIARAQPAAVLAPIIARSSGPTMLLTLRAATMRSHSGQVAFPGGKIDAGETPQAAALREAHEEIGLEARHIETLGWLDPYLTGSGYRIMPLLAILDPGFTLTINKHEVEDVFETPLRFLMDPANHQRHQREWQGRMRQYYAMPHEGRYIWGATAGILRNLYERLYR
jgi:8-oxo-dGTP pyrophosphatase MutT (NUDIX family)